MPAGKRALTAAAHMLVLEALCLHEGYGQCKEAAMTRHEKRQPDDYQKAADDSLELANALAGQGGISDQDFLERMARSDDLVDHDGETCGMCQRLSEK